LATRAGRVYADLEGAPLPARRGPWGVGLPSNLDAQMKRRPYATLGVAGAIGMGMGILLGSRILRSVLVSAVSLAVVELGRAYMRQGGGLVHGSGTARAIDES
jgi:hypothetical protein